MKRILLIFTACAALIASSTASALDLKTIVKKATEKSDGKSGSAIGDAISGLLSNDNVSFDDLVGTWTYSSPAVKFKSSNLLKKAGGAAVTGTIENKLETYYKTAGLNNLTMTVNADSTFVIKVKSISLNGTITATGAKDGANFIFNFKAIKKISLGKMNTYISKSGSTIDVAFDISKLVSLLQKLSSVAGSKSISTVSSLLSSYDGVCAGFRLTKSN